MIVVLAAQSYLTPFDSMNWSPPGSSVHQILQARILEWVAIPFPRGSSQPKDRTQVSNIAGRFFTVWATQAYMINVLKIFVKILFNLYLVFNYIKYSQNKNKLVTFQIKPSK